MKKAWKDIILVSIMGVLYMALEILWRGKTDISMMLVGGLCAFLTGRLNERPSFYEDKIWKQCLTGTVITLVIEFVSGIILNVWLNLNIWTYAGMFGNICGQICLPYAFLWFLLMPLCIYVDDYLRYRLFGEEKPDSILENYKKLIRGK
jgi:uncharacterized membrane protein